jgi:hypothetical protein
MQTVRKMGLVALVLVCGVLPVRAGIFIGVGVAPAPYYYRPYGYYPYYRPYPVYVPPPVVVVPPPVVVQPAPAYAPPAAPAPVYAPPTATTSAAPPTSAEPPLAPAQPPAPLPLPREAQSGSPALTPTAANRPTQIDTYLQQLASPDEQVRADALVQLGRMKAHRADGAITRALKDDPSPAVREAAARALGLIGDLRSLEALQYAAQADRDRDVRKSASFAAEVIRGRLSR